MGKILLDYVFPISVITPTPEASTAFLKQVCVVAKPKSGQEGNVGDMFLCTSMSAVAVRTDNTNAQQLFNAGMNRVFILLANNLDLESALEDKLGEFYTLLISDDYDDDDLSQAITVAGVKASVKIQDILYTAKDEGEDGSDITITYVNDGTGGAETVGVSGSAITVHMQTGVSTADNIRDAIEASGPADALVDLTVDSGDESDVQSAASSTPLTGGVDEEVDDDTGLSVGAYDGVIGVSTQDSDVASAQSAIEKRCVFISNSSNKAKNLFFAFGSLLANPSDWTNQQYITMPFAEDVDELGEAEAFFDDKVSFVIEDDEFGTRLGLFCVGGRAIVAPYILKNLQVNLQSRALSWISGNQPQYNIKEATLLETRLQQDVINEFIALNWITAGVVEITLVEDNFVANGSINVAEPKALWRVFSEMRQTL